MNNPGISKADNLYKINKQAIKILKKSPNTLLEYLSTNSANLTIDSENKVAEQKKSVFSDLRFAKQIDKNRTIANQKIQANLLSKYVFNKFFICCKESRIENPTSFYGCFYIGPFDESLSQTLAHNIRRTLLSQLSGFAITAVEIDGVLHKFSNLPGIKETVLDIICNLQNLVFKENIKTDFALALKTNNSMRSNLQKLEFTAFLRVRGPGIVTAADILLPSGLQCVNPDQYIATLAEDGILNIKIYISAGQGQNYIKQKQKNMDLADIKQQYLVDQYTAEQHIKDFTNPQNKSNSDNTDLNLPLVGDQTNQNFLLTNIKKNKIYLDSVFMPVTKVNTFVQANDKCTDDLLENNLQFRFIPSIDSADRNLLEQSANFNTILTTSSFNIDYQETANDLLRKSEQEQMRSTTNSAPLFAEKIVNNSQTRKQPVKTFFSCSESISTKTSNLKEQVMVLTETNKIGGNSLNIKKQCHIVVEIWTNGSIHPREALKNSLQFLATTFSTLENIKMLGSMFKSDITYSKLIKTQKAKKPKI